MRDYGLVRAISTPGDTHGLAHERSGTADAYLICRGFIIDCSGLKTNGKHIDESGSELRDYGLARNLDPGGYTQANP